MNLETIREKMNNGEIYDPADPELLRYQLACIERVNVFNRTPATEAGLQERTRLLKEMFGELGEGCYIEPPFHANFGGKNVSFGNNVYANFNLTLVDDGSIRVGDGCLIGPNVTLVTACHPVDPKLRAHGLQYNLPVTIGNHVWLGAGVIVLAGVKIGDNSIVGAGAVVTKDIPAGVVAVGNPCRILRRITEADRISYDHGKPIPEEILKKYT